MRRLLLLIFIVLISCNDQTFMDRVRSVEEGTEENTNLNPEDFEDFQENEACDICDPNAPTEQEIFSCSEILGTSIDQIKIAGNSSTYDFKINKPTLFKVHGSMAKISVEIVAEIPGICIFAAGNEPKINVNAKAKMKTFYIRLAGNKGVINMFNDPSAAFDKGNIKIYGNQTKVTFHDSVNCPGEIDLLSYGNSNGIFCE